MNQARTPSLFDSAEFNGTLFFPRGDRSEPAEGARDLFVDTADGAKVHVRVHGDGGGVGLAVVLLFHGNGEVVSDYDDAAKDYARAGALLAVADFRGYGASTGTPTFRNMLSDAPLVLEAVSAATSLPIVVMGRSLGGACAAELCRETRPRVAGYIFESSGSDLAELVKRRGLSVPTFSDAERAMFDPLPKMASCKTPTLILHGERDDIIHFREAEATHRAIAGSTLVPIEGRGHNDLSRSTIYWEALSRFLRSAP